MFNHLIGNSDAHAKNISILVDAQGFRLAPYYDLLCVRAYGDEGLALFIGDEETFDAVGRHSWEAWCDDCGFRLNETLRAFCKLAQRGLPAWASVHRRLLDLQGLTDEERELLQRMTAVFERQVANATFHGTVVS